MATTPSGAAKITKAADKAGWTTEAEKCGDNDFSSYVLTGECDGLRFQAAWKRRGAGRWTPDGASTLTEDHPEWHTATLLQIGALIRENEAQPDAAAPVAHADEPAASFDAPATETVTVEPAPQPEASPRGISAARVASGVYTTQHTGAGLEVAAFGALYTVRRVAAGSYLAWTGRDTTAAPIATAATLPTAVTAAKQHARQSTRSTYAQAA